MTLGMMTSTVLLAAIASAAEIDPKVLRLIPPGARVIYGIDVERYRSSTLEEFYPVRFDFLSTIAGNPSLAIRQVVVVEGRAQNRTTRMTVLYGTALLSACLLTAAEPGGRTGYRGIPQFSSEGSEVIALLGNDMAITANLGTAQEAIDFWHEQRNLDENLTAKIRKLSSSYDNWFLAVKPLENIEGMVPSRGLKHRNELMQAIEEVRGGIRVGASNDVEVELIMKTPEDANALAAVSRWLPGLVQMERSYSQESLLADVAENLTVQAEGRIVRVSFSLRENALQELVRSWRPAEQDSP